MDRHEIPTHLNVEDKAFAGLTMRQLMTAAVGLASGVRRGQRAAVAAAAPARRGRPSCWRRWRCSRSGGRRAGPLEDWAFVLLRYWAIPRIAVWRPRERTRRSADETPTSYEVVRARAGLERTRRGRQRKEVPVQRSNDRRLASVQELLPAGRDRRRRALPARRRLPRGPAGAERQLRPEVRGGAGGDHGRLPAPSSTPSSYPLQVLVRILPTDVEPYLDGLRRRPRPRRRDAPPAGPRPRGVRAAAGAGADAARAPLLRRRPGGLEGAFERRGIRWPWQAEPRDAPPAP